MYSVVQVSEQELAQALEAAVTCCILAAAGPQRSRVLANLYKDERTRTLPVFPFLEKVYLERILQRAEVHHPHNDLHLVFICVQLHQALPEDKLMQHTLLVYQQLAHKSISVITHRLSCGLCTSA